jgi:hypothetical protein
MIAWMPSKQYRYYVEYKEPEGSWRSDKTKDIYIYSTSELTVREILADYRILLVNKAE